MILFYDKTNGNVIGTVNGRVHSDFVIDNLMINPSGIPEANIGKYVVPTKERVEEVREDVFENRVVDKVTMRVEPVKVGTKMVKNVAELVPDVKYVDIIKDLEDGKVDLKDLRAVIDGKGSLVNIKYISKKV